jgi:hypothetical protein
MKNIEILYMKIFCIADKKIPKDCTGGDCFVVSGKYMMDHCIFETSDLKLAHGTVVGQGRIKGVKYEHAWIEQNGIVIDLSLGRDIRMPKDVYYALGNIENVKLYGCAEFRKMINQYGHWGPW